MFADLPLSESVEAMKGKPASELVGLIPGTSVLVQSVISDEEFEYLISEEQMLWYQDFGGKYPRAMLTALLETMGIFTMESEQGWDGDIWARQMYLTPESVFHVDIPNYRVEVRAAVKALAENKEESWGFLYFLAKTYMIAIRVFCWLKDGRYAVVLCDPSRDIREAPFLRRFPYFSLAYENGCWHPVHREDRPHYRVATSGDGKIDIHKGVLTWRIIKPRVALGEFVRSDDELGWAVWKGSGSQNRAIDILGLSNTAVQDDGYRGLELRPVRRPEPPRRLPASYAAEESEELQPRVSAPRFGSPSDGAVRPVFRSPDSDYNQRVATSGSGARASSRDEGRSRNSHAYVAPYDGPGATPYRSLVQPNQERFQHQERVGDRASQRFAGLVGATGTLSGGVNTPSPSRSWYGPAKHSPSVQNGGEEDRYWTTPITAERPREASQLSGGNGAGRFQLEESSAGVFADLYPNSAQATSIAVTQAMGTKRRNARIAADEVMPADRSGGSEMGSSDGDVRVYSEDDLPRPEWEKRRRFDDDDNTDGGAAYPGATRSTRSTSRQPRESSKSSGESTQRSTASSSSSTNASGGLANSMLSTSALRVQTVNTATLPELSSLLPSALATFMNSYDKLARSASPPSVWQCLARSLHHTLLAVAQVAKAVPEGTSMDEFRERLLGPEGIEVISAIYRHQTTSKFPESVPGDLMCRKMTQTIRYPETTYLEQLAGLRERKHWTYGRTSAYLVKGLKTNYAPLQDELKAFMKQNRGTQTEEQLYVKLVMKLISEFDAMRQALETADVFWRNGSGGTGTFDKKKEYKTTDQKRKPSSDKNTSAPNKTTPENKSTPKADPKPDNSSKKKHDQKNPNRPDKKKKFSLNAMTQDQSTSDSSTDED